MKILQATVLVSFLLGSLAAQAGSPSIDLTVSGEVSPGVYGEVHIGNTTPPPVVYAQPVIIAKPQHDDDDQRPMYLHVPPGQAKKWARYCRQYNACNRPVYFVKSAEYEPSYRPRKEKDRREEGRRDDGDQGDQWGGEGRGKGRGHGHGKEGRGNGRD